MAKTKSELLNEKYWGARSANLWLNLEKDEVALLTKLEKRYDDLLVGIDKEIASYFTKYGKDGILQYSSMLPVLTPAEVNVLKKDWAGFLELYPEFEDLAPVEGSIYKLNRLQGLQSSILSEQMKIGAKNIADIEKHLIKTGMNGLNTSTLALGKSFNTINPNVVKNLVNEDWIQKGDFKSSVWGNTKKVNDFVIKDFRDGVIRGDKYDDMIKNLGKHYNDVSKSDIRRLIYTEGTHVLNESMAKGFEADYEEYIYVAHMDEKTSTVCQGLNGTTFKFAERSPGLNFPPMHPRCRSTFTVVIPGEDELPVQVEPVIPQIQNPLDVKAKASLQKVYNQKGYVDVTDIVKATDAILDPDEVKAVKDAFTASGLKFDEYLTSQGFPTLKEYKDALDGMVKNALDAVITKKGWIDTTHMKLDLSDEGYKLATDQKALTGLNWKKYVESLGYKTAPDNELWTKGKLKIKIDEMKKEKDDLLKPYGGSKNDMMNVGTADEIDTLLGLEDDLFIYEEKLFVKLKKENMKIAKADVADTQKSLDDFVASADMQKDYGELYHNATTPQTLADYASHQATIKAKIDYYDNKLFGAGDPALTQQWFDLKLLAEQYKKLGEEYLTRLEALKKAQTKLTTIKKSNIIKGGNSNDYFTQEHKDNALWSKTVKEGDNAFRDKSGEVWRTATQLEKDSAYSYTSGSGKFNRPSAGFRKPRNAPTTCDGWDDKYNVGMDKVWLDFEYAGDGVRAITDLINRSEYDFDAWLQRGVYSNALKNVLGVDITGMAQSQLDKFVGKKFVWGNFLSCGGSKGKGFDRPVILNVYCPRGTKMLYAEPWSAFSGANVGKAWDGVSTQSTFHDEFEVILQRGGSYTITKMETNYGKIYVDIEVHPEDGYQLYQQDPSEWKGATDHAW